MYCKNSEKYSFIDYFSSALNDNTACSMCVCHGRQLLLVSGHIRNYQQPSCLLTDINNVRIGSLNLINKQKTHDGSGLLGHVTQLRVTCRDITKPHHAPVTTRLLLNTKRKHLPQKSAFYVRFANILPR